MHVRVSCREIQLDFRNSTSAHDRQRNKRSKMLSEKCFLSHYCIIFNLYLPIRAFDAGIISMHPLRTKPKYSSV